MVSFSKIWSRLTSLVPARLGCQPGAGSSSSSSSTIVYPFHVGITGHSAVYRTCNKHCRCACVRLRCGQWSSEFSLAEVKMPLIDDLRQTDRDTASTRAGLRRCCWPRPHHTAGPADLAGRWWRHSGNLLLRPIIDTRSIDTRVAPTFLHWP